MKKLFIFLIILIGIGGIFTSNLVVDCDDIYESFYIPRGDFIDENNVYYDFIDEKTAEAFTKYIDKQDVNIIILDEVAGRAVTRVNMKDISGVGMATEITIPQTVLEFCFFNTNYLKKITVLGTNLKYMSFEACDNLEEVNIPEGTERIGFFECYNLKEITIPNGVIDIYFGKCYSLNKVNIPKSITYIRSCDFWGCPNLVIYGYLNSCAESYALENDIPFVAFDEEPTLIGDVNGDSEINVVDVIYLAKAIANRITLTDEQIVNANIDGVSGVSSDNLILLIKYLIGEINF